MCKPRTLTTDDVTFSVRAEVEDTPPYGNVLASGNDAEDRAAERAVIASLQAPATTGPGAS